MIPNPIPNLAVVANPEDYILVDQGDNFNVQLLSKIFADDNKRVHVSDVFDDGNHVVEYRDAATGGKLLLFESEDQKTSKWVPQGITSTSDALGDGVYEGKEGWIVSWHMAHDKGARVTFVNRETKKYRHALLVCPNTADDFDNVHCHAGGIVWYGDTLWVVDTHRGILVFDITNIWQVDDGNGVGKKADGKGFSAAGYKYVIPQIRWYKWASSFPFQFSFVSLDRTDKDEPDSLLIGEWNPKGEGARLMQWELDYKTRKLKTSQGSGVAKATKGYIADINSMQGAVRAHGKIYISRTHKHEDGDMFGWIPGREARLNEHFFPPGPEDLSYDGKRDRIYGVTELGPTRSIVIIKPGDVKFD